MTNNPPDPTPEEILLSKMSPMEQGEFRRRDDVNEAQEFVEGLTLQKIRAAVAAERERCAKVAERCCSCDCLRHSQKWEIPAAIWRALPDNQVENLILAITELEDD